MDENMLAAMADQAQAETRTSVPEKTETKPEDVSAVDSETVGDIQDFSRTPWDDRTPEEQGIETPEPLKTETDTETETDKTDTETKTNTETSEETAPETQEVEAEPVVDNTEWLKTLPEPPADLNITTPEYDEDGNVTNMTGKEFLDYTVELARHGAKIENYNNTVLNRSMEEAERILPEIKTNDTIRTLFENQLVAMTVNGNGTAVDAALAINALRGDSKAEGAQSVKNRIEVVKNSAVESPSKSDTQQKGGIDKKLAARLKANDTDAFSELFDSWQDQGKI